MESESEMTKKTVLAYIDALDHHNYDSAAALISDNVRIIGPAGENFGKPLDFTRMLSRFKGKYDLKRIFVDQNEVSLLYDFTMGGTAVYMSSWYRVKDGKIEFIRTIFDPNAFSDKP